MQNEMFLKFYTNIGIIILITMYNSHLFKLFKIFKNHNNLRSAANTFKLEVRLKEGTDIKMQIPPEDSFHLYCNY